LVRRLKCPGTYLRKSSTLSSLIVDPSNHLRHPANHSNGLKAVLKAVQNSHGKKAAPSSNRVPKTVLNSRKLRKSPLRAIKRHPVHRSRVNGSSKSKKIETSGHYKHEVITTIEEIASYEGF
jgi:hypothetical protein